MDVAGVLKHLEGLVAFDTQNPPRSLTAESPIFGWICDVLGADFEIEITDHGLGRISMLAVRGKPSLLFNVHLDTVPVIEGSRFPALELTWDEDRVYGRGSCDIKGAAACLLEIAGATDEPMALLFTTDEEGASGCCVSEFVSSGQSRVFKQVVVAEPTDCLAVMSHRGYLSVKGEFSG
jgi:acetylornithine deacetylase